MFVLVSKTYCEENAQREREYPWLVMRWSHGIISFFSLKVFTTYERYMINSKAVLTRRSRCTYNLPFTTYERYMINSKAVLTRRPRSTYNLPFDKKSLASYSMLRKTCPLRIFRSRFLRRIMHQVPLYCFLFGALHVTCVRFILNNRRAVHAIP
jgi:hypothetical protein